LTQKQEQDDGECEPSRAPRSHSSSLRSASTGRTVRCTTTGDLSFQACRPHPALLGRGRDSRRRQDVLVSDS
jgi:hypothetical protein